MPISCDSIRNEDKIDEFINTALHCNECIFSCNDTNKLINLVETYLKAINKCVCYKSKPEQVEIEKSIMQNTQRAQIEFDLLDNKSIMINISIV